jgi:prolyl-tRNA synthetase
MKLDKLVGERFKERPANCTFDSHALLIRGGYIKSTDTGIYALALPMRRIMRKMEQIIHEEMQTINGQEVLLPTLPSENPLPDPGRYDKTKSKFGSFNEFGKTADDNSPCFQEAAIRFVQEYGQTYAKYPFMIYQIQGRLCDQTQLKTGILNLREGMVKDGYSFHISKEDLAEYYDKCRSAYERIFNRIGIPGATAFISDNEITGRGKAHKFLLENPEGDAEIAICQECDYRADVEVAQSITEPSRDDVSEEMTLVHTPDMKTIEAVCDFLKTTEDKTTKAVVYQRNSDDSYIVAFLRGDLDISETKLKRHLGCDIYPALITLESGICAGYIGPHDLDEKITVLFDSSLKGANNLVCGANQEEYHYSGFDMDRDLPDARFTDLAKILEGGVCPKCGKASISFLHGVEVGGIFELGSVFSEALDMQYSDSEGNDSFPVMGQYETNITQLVAAVCEENRDDYGPIWPIQVVPWQVHICALRFNNADVAKVSTELYDELSKAGVEVMFDDRLVSAGVMFADADLLGAPIRVIVGPKTVGNGVVEIKARDKSFAETVSTNDAATFIQSTIERMLAADPTRSETSA